MTAQGHRGIASVSIISSLSYTRVIPFIRCCPCAIAVELVCAERCSESSIIIIIIMSVESASCRYSNQGAEVSSPPRRSRGAEASSQGAQGGGPGRPHPSGGGGRGGRGGREFRELGSFNEHSLYAFFGFLHKHKLENTPLTHSF